MDHTYLANIFCQNCGQPVKLDSTLLDFTSLETHGTQHLKQKITPRFPQKSAATSLKQTAIRRPSFPSRLERPIVDLDLSVQIQDSFIILSPESGNTDTRDHVLKLSPLESDRGKLSHRLKVSNNLFDFINDAFKLDHPMCQECSEEMLLKLDARVVELRKEKEMYSKYLSSVEESEKVKIIANENEGNYTGVDLIDEAAQKISIDERRIQTVKILEELDNEHEMLKVKLEDSLEQIKLVDAQELDYFKELNVYEESMYDLQEQLASVNLQYELANARLEQLENTNVFDDVFTILHDGPIATINGLRLGRLPDQHVCFWLI